jgi:phage virion morphogenesis protein
MLRIDSDLDGYKRSINSAIKEWTDLTPHMRAIGDYLESITDERFDNQRAPNGRRWAALSPRYAKRKAKDPRKKKGAGILVLTSRMRKDIKKKATKNSVELGIKDGASNETKKKAAAHNYGAPKRNIPARPFIGLTNDDRKEILGILSLSPDRLKGKKPKK